MRRVQRRAGRSHRRVPAFVLAGLALAGAVLAAGLSDGYPATRPRLMSGAAWLASAQVGQLTLLDGSSAEVAAQVQVAPPGGGLDVVQQGQTAYAVDRAAGSIRRVDGATFALTPPVVPIPDAGPDLHAFAGPDALYALDAGRGVLTTADVRTLAKLAGPMSLASRVGPQSATLDGAGRLWLLDAATGDLVWFDGSHRQVRSGAAAPGVGLLTQAGGVPVLVDLARRTAEVLDRGSGTTSHRTRLDLRPEDRVQVGGSLDARRLYVVASRGVLFICDLTASACPAAVPLTAGHPDLGAPVEAGGRVFVPDYATGQVWIVDAAGLQVIAQPQVLPAGTRFQLLTRDGVVFFNDPGSERAGVLRLDGGLRRVVKYNPGDPTKGLDNPAGENVSPPSPAATPGQPDRPDQPDQPDRGQPGNPTDPSRPPTDPPPTAPPTGPPTTPPTGTSPQFTITASVSRPTVGQEVVLSVATNGGPQPAGAHWSFGDGTAGDGLPISHRWSTARTFQLSVTATFPDGSTGTRSVSIPVTANPTLSVTVSPPGEGLVTTSPNVMSCTSACAAPVPPGQTITLSALPFQGRRFTGWTGCPGTTPTPTTCQFVMPTAGVTVGAGFAANLVPVTVDVRGTGTGTVRGNGISCPADCTGSFTPGTRVTLTASPGALTTFGGWGSPCSGTSLTCAFTVASATSVTATFTRFTSNTVPNVLGEDLDVALDAINAAGFRGAIVGEVEDSAACNRVGTIATQSPTGGAVLPLGSTVSVKVFVKPKPPRVCG